eukprot:scaffold200394_cov32-Tisochrysis_lutea.AAC.3
MPSWHDSCEHRAFVEAFIHDQEEDSEMVRDNLHRKTIGPHAPMGTDLLTTKQNAPAQLLEGLDTLHEAKSCRPRAGKRFKTIALY